MEVAEHLNNFKIGSLPTLFYIPDFISDLEQNQILNNIYQAPASKWKSLKNRRLQNWGGVVHEKGLLPQDLPAWLTRITEKISQESGLFPSAINHVLINEYLPNQGIMPHQDGPAYFPVVAILSLGSPVVMDFSPHASLKDCTSKPTNSSQNNISEDRILEKENEEDLEKYCSFSIVLMPRSLLIFKDKAYSDYLHGIKDCETQQYDGVVNASGALAHLGVTHDQFGSVKLGDGEGSNVIHRTTNRVSLTCRLVPKVHRNLFKF